MQFAAISGTLGSLPMPNSERACNSGISHRELLVVFNCSTIVLLSIVCPLACMDQLKILDLGPDLIVSYEPLHISHLEFDGLLLLTNNRDVTHHVRDIISDRLAPLALVSRPASACGQVRA